MMQRRFEITVLMHHHRQKYPDRHGDHPSAEDRQKRRRHMMEQQRFPELPGPQQDLKRARKDVAAVDNHRSRLPENKKACPQYKGRIVYSVFTVFLLIHDPYPADQSSGARYTSEGARDSLIRPFSSIQSMISCQSFSCMERKGRPSCSISGIRIS